MYILARDVMITRDQVANFWQGSVQKHDFQPSVQIWEFLQNYEQTTSYVKHIQKKVIRKENWISNSKLLKYQFLIIYGISIVFIKATDLDLFRFWKKVCLDLKSTVQAFELKKYSLSVIQLLLFNFHGIWLPCYLFQHPLIYFSIYERPFKIRK